MAAPGVIRTILNPPAGYKVPRPNPLAPNLTISPDYGNLITTNPDYVTGESALTNTLGHAGTSRAETIRQALIRYGATPGGYTDAYGDITPETTAAAQNNPHSIFQDLLDQYHNSQNTLEQRGIYQSGAQATVGNQYEGARQHATEDLDSIISGAIAGYTGAQDQYSAGHGQLVNTIRTALQQDPSIRSFTAHIVPGSRLRYGQPVYAGPDGALYTADQKPFTPPPENVGPSQAVRAISNPSGVL